MEGFFICFYWDIYNDMKILITEKQLKGITSDWDIVKGKLQKKFKFDSYSEVLDFVDKVGKIAEKQNHHPDMIVKYGEVIVTMFDHEEGKISDKCHKFVDAVNKIK
jgi:pterin-4a-carbinolamine dehydratase